MNGIVNAHKAEFDAEPEVVVEVPQVTTFLGAFADFCKGYSLMSTNTQGLRVAVSRRPDQMVIAFNSTSKERKKFQITGIRAKREDRWASVIKGLCQLLIASGFRLPSGFNLTIKGQSAVADPPALSAALASGLVVAFNELFFTQRQCALRKLFTEKATCGINVESAVPYSASKPEFSSFFDIMFFRT